MTLCAWCTAPIRDAEPAVRIPGGFMHSGCWCDWQESEHEVATAR